MATAAVSAAGKHTTGGQRVRVSSPLDVMLTQVREAAAYCATGSDFVLFRV